MTTPTHVAVNLGVFLILMQVKTLNPNYLDLALIVGSNFIDLDHLPAKPIFDPKRDPFKTHFFHKQWKILLAILGAMLFFRKVMFLSIGILLHFLLDYINVRTINT